MQNQKPLGTRVLSLALTAAMVATMMPQNVFAQGTDPVDAGGVTTTRTITAVGELGEGFAKSVPFDGHTYVLDVKANTPLSEVKLPTELSVTVEKITTNATAPATETPVAETPVVETPAVETPVASEATSTEPAAPTTDVNTTVLGNEPATPSGAEPAPVEKPAEVAPTAPNQGNTTIIETTQENVPVTWNGDKEYTAEPDSNVVYTAVLPEGCALKDGVVLPIINVMVGKKVMTPMTAMARAVTPVQRTTPLDLATNANITYIGSDGSTSKTANPTTASITDTGEGWSWNLGTKTLTLSGANIDCSASTISGEAFGIKLSPAYNIVLTNGTTNTVKAGASSDFNSAGIIFTNVAGSPKISGTGTLNVTGGGVTSSNASYGISCNPRVTLTISDATIVATTGTTGTSGTSRAGIYAKLLDVKSGNITATGTGGTNGYGIFIEEMTMSDGTVTATGGGSGAQVFGINGTKLKMTGGTLSASAPGKIAIQINTSVTATGAKVTGTNDTFTNGSHAVLKQSGANPVVISFAPEKPLDEQFKLPLGGTYYFDLSGEVGNVGTVNTSVPDTTLHYVPFTYAGTVNAYSLDSTSIGKTDSSAKATPSDRSLFVSDYAISNLKSWNDLNTANLIFGKPFDTNYTLRSLSVGSGKISGIVSPVTNEWDSILKKSGLTDPIKNWGVYSLGQDTDRLDGTKRSLRGYVSSSAIQSIACTYSAETVSFRPALEVKNPTTLTKEGLKAVTLNLNGGTFNSSASPINIVCAGANFKAPSATGLTRPSGNTDTGFGWNTQADGKGISYAAGASVPNSVTTLYAQWTAPVVPGVIEVDGTIKTLKKAMEEVAEGDTIKLTADINLGNDSAIVSQYSGKGNFTIDLNGHTLTSNVVTIDYSGRKTLTITDGASGGTVKTDAPNANICAIVNNGIGTISVTKGTVSATGTAIRNNSTGTISITGGTVSGTHNKTIFNEGTGTIDISGGTVRSETGIAIQNANVGTINLSGSATVTSACTNENVATIYLQFGTAGKDILNISGNAVVSDTGGKASVIRNNGVGTISMTGGTVSTTTGKAIWNNSTGAINVSGGEVSAPTGTAIWNYSTGTINVSGGKVSATTGKAIFNNETGAINVSGSSTVSATTGIAIWNRCGKITVSGDATVTSQNIEYHYYGTIYFDAVPTGSDKVILTVEGNAKVTNTANPEGESACFPQRSTPTEHYKVVTPATLGKVFPEAAPVEPGVATESELRDAFANATGDTIIKLTADIDFHYDISILASNTYNFTLDLNGYNLSANNGGTLVNGSPTTLTVKDSSGKAGTISVKVNYTAIWNADENGILDIYDVTIQGSGDADYAHIIENAGTLNIHSGTIKETGIGKAIENSFSGTANIMGGIVQGTGTSKAIENAGTANISGGTVKAENNAAISNYYGQGKYIISGADTVITSAATGDNGTIFFHGNPRQKDILIINDGTISNTASPEGYSVYFAVDSNVTGSNLSNYYTKTNGTVGKVFPVATAPSISLDSRNGDPITIAEIAANGTIAMPAAPKWGNYTFGGWYTEADGKGTVFANSGLTASTTVYAKWTAANGKSVLTESLDLSTATTDLSGDGWKWDHATKTLTLSGITLNSTKLGASKEAVGIMFPRVDCTIILEDGTENTVDVSSAKNADSSYGICTISTLTIKTSGKGTPGKLNAIAGNATNPSNGIYAGSGIVIESGNITAKSGDSTDANSAGIWAINGDIHIKGGTVNATGGKSGDSASGALSAGMFGTNIQIDDGTVTATGSEEVNALKTSAGILGTANVKLKGGIINAKGTTAAVAAATTNGLVIDDIANVKVNGNTAKVGRITIDGTDSATLVNADDTIITNAAIKFKPTYKGENVLAPNAAKAIRTHNTITLETKTIAGETVQYGKKNVDGTILWQDSPIFGGLNADTPYTFYSRVKANDTHKAGTTSDETIIKTKTAPVSVSGTVNGSNNSPLEGATVQLKQGNTVVKTSTTNASGVYTFADVPEGVYSLVLTNGTVTITDSVTVPGTNLTSKDMKFLDGKKNTVVESKPGTPEVAVGGLNDLLTGAKLDQTLETQAQKDAVTAGGSVDLTFTADLKTPGNVGTDKEEIEKVANGQKIDMLLDLSVLKTVKDKDGKPVTTNEKIDTLADIIAINIPIPAELQGKADLNLYRMHKGEAKALPKGSNNAVGGEYYTIDASKTFMTVHVKNFSTYAIGYTAFDVTITGASGSGKYAPGDVVTIDAGSKSGYTFDSWTVTPNNVTLANANSATTTFVMPAEAVTLTANWTYTGGGTGGNPGGNPAPQVYYYINATTSRGGSINTPERVKVIAGGSASFTITPDKGYQIADVLVNGNSIGAKNSYVFTNVNADQTIHATFKKAGHRNPQTGVDANEG